MNTQDDADDSEGGTWRENVLVICFLVVAVSVAYFMIGPRFGWVKL